MAKAGGGGGRTGGGGGGAGGGRAFRSAVASTQGDLLDYEKTHRLSASARHRMQRAMDALARARYARVGQETAAYEKAQRVLDFIGRYGIRGIAFGSGVPGL